MTDLSQTIATAQPASKRTAFDLLESMRGELAKALPHHVSIDHFLRLALTELRMNPALGNASGESLLGAFMTAARLGLEVGGPTGEFYLVPRKQHGTPVVVPIVGYRGLLKLARNAGVGAIDAVVVREGDLFDEGANAERGFYFEWKPGQGGTAREPIGVLAVAKLRGGDVQHRYLTMAQVLDRKGRGAAGERGPWATDQDAMIRKTGLRSLWSVLPQSTETALAAQVDEQVVEYRPDDPRWVAPQLEPAERPESDA